jgi:hypothetical protein
VAFLVAAAITWWHARLGGFFFIVGMQGSASANLGPVLPAFCAGASAALTLLIVDAAAGAWAGAVAALAVVVLPGFMSLHRESLVGPPLLTLTLLMLAVMLHAPRFSLAYGTLAATAAAFVSPQAIGLPVGAAVWALVQRAHPTSMRRRAALAVLPLLAAVVLLRLNADKWLGGSALGWRGQLDRVVHDAGILLAAQLAPGVGGTGLRALIIGDLSILAVLIVSVAWWRVARPLPDASLLRRLYPAALVLAVTYAAGFAVRTLLVRGAPDPDLTSLVPLFALAVIVITSSIATLWTVWPRWERGVAALVLVWWLQAAVRG